MKEILLVATGGALGSVARHLLSRAIAQNFENSIIPVAVITVNVIGCFAIGVASALIMEKVEYWALSKFAVTGFLAGFTTYSSFTLEAMQLFQNNPTKAIIYLCLSITLGLIACFLGYYIIKQNS